MSKVQWVCPRVAFVNFPRRLGRDPLGGRMLGAGKIDRAPASPGFGRHGQGLLRVPPGYVQRRRRVRVGFHFARPFLRFCILKTNTLPAPHSRFRVEIGLNDGQNVCLLFFPRLAK